MEFCPENTYNIYDYSLASDDFYSTADSTWCIGDECTITECCKLVSPSQ